VKFSVYVDALAIFLLVASFTSCSQDLGTGEDANVTTLGTVEITAKLVEIPGEFPSNKLYDYGYVMKYSVGEVHRGEVPGDTLYVGHYNPLKPRDRVKDARVDDVGGTLRRFRVGDTHRMALEVPIDDNCMAGIVNEYAGQDTGPIYWAVWTNPAAGQ
jgi:hypothetical protein